MNHLGVFLCLVGFLGMKVEAKGQKAVWLSLAIVAGLVAVEGILIWREI